MGKIRFVGLDVHAESIAVAVAEDGRDGEVRSLGVIPNRASSLARLVKKLGGPAGLKVCYEAGVCGFAVYWHLMALDVECQVVAPGLIPVRPTDRVKTDRRDAEKLARLLRSGELTFCWVPDKQTEALRDLIRAREAAVKDKTRARHRLRKLMIRRDQRPPNGAKPNTEKWLAWAKTVQFDEPALDATCLDYVTELEHMAGRVVRLEQAIDEAVASAPEPLRVVVDAYQALRGAKKVVAATLAAEIGDVSRFPHPRKLMSYAGLVASEHSSGGPGKANRGGITKSGNAHLRRVAGEMAWTYRYKPNIGIDHRQRQKNLPEPIKEIAWKAQHRLHKRFRQLTARGKPKQKAVMAVARELLGFIWAVGIEAERTRRAATVA